MVHRYPRPLFKGSSVQNLVIYGDLGAGSRFSPGRREPHLRVVFCVEDAGSRSSEENVALGLLAVSQLGSSPSKVTLKTYAIGRLLIRPQKKWA